MSNQLVLALVTLFAISIYLVFVFLLPKKYTQHTSQRMKTVMQRLAEQREVAATYEIKDLAQPKKIEDNFLVKAYLSLPFVSGEMAVIEQAGLMEHFDRVILAGIALLVVLFIATYPLGMFSLLIAPLTTYIVMYVFVAKRAKKRHRQFLDSFPDALDIIVRSVRAGYPINNAIAMVADTMPPEVGEEYMRIVNESSYGYTLAEAVNRFAERINQSDVSFFSVVVSVQQETGGNLAEILGNLSSLIRQRKHLRLKVKALSAEGRMTVIVLIGIAIFMVGLVYIFSPTHFKPLLETSAGHTVMTVIGCIFIGTYFVIRRIINFRI